MTTSITLYPTTILFVDFYVFTRYPSPIFLKLFVLSFSDPPELYDNYLYATITERVTPESCFTLRTIYCVIVESFIHLIVLV